MSTTSEAVASKSVGQGCNAHARCIRRAYTTVRAVCVDARQVSDNEAARAAAVAVHSLPRRTSAILPGGGCLLHSTNALRGKEAPVDKLNPRIAGARTRPCAAATYGGVQLSDTLDLRARGSETAERDATDARFRPTVSPGQPRETIHSCSSRSELSQRSCALLRRASAATCQALHRRMRRKHRIDWTRGSRRCSGAVATWALQQQHEQVLEVLNFLNR